MTIAYHASPAVLGDLDVALSRALARRYPDSTRESLLAAALASWAVQQGHACMDFDLLRADAGLRELVESDPRVGALDVDALIHAARSAPFAQGDACPVTVDGARVYLRRYFRYEVEIAELLGARLAATCVDEPSTDAPWRAWFAGAEAADPQRRAVERAASTTLLVLSGGPGTGKTWTVARAIAALALRDEVTRIALAAPTGKAAARLAQSVSEAIARVDLPPAARAKLPAGATTLHRLLGLHPDRVDPRHGVDHPLMLDVLVVDEASMLDLALFAKLLRAVPPACRLILVGDPDQLPSVEAGAPFSSLVAAGEASAAAAAIAPLPTIATPNVAGATGAAAAAHVAAPTTSASPGKRRRAADPDSPQGELFASAAASAGTAIPSNFVRLARARRFSAGSSIAALVDAIRDARVDAVVDHLRADASGAIIWHDGSIGTYRGAFDALAASRYRAIADARSPSDALAALARFRVLCALREGPAGVAGLNASIEQSLGIRRGTRHAHGRPLLVTGNDTEIGLYNGDAGVLLRDGHDGAAWFARGDGMPESIPLAQLPAHETGYAMTVHKAQGSEFDELAIVLPGEPHPLVTREWLYTAISRAKTTVHVFGPEATVRAGVERATVRMSGLATRLKAAPPA